MHAAGARHHRGPRRRTRRRCRPRRSPRARRCCAGSPTTTSRSSATASTASRRDDDGRRRCAPCPAPASASCAPTRTCPPSFAEAAAAGAGQGPREDAAGAHQGQLQGHRAPAGLPRLRRRQDVRRERRGRRRAALPRPVLLGRLHRVADPHPGDPRARPTQVIDRAGFAPLSHTGKALMDILETYPRDELFQTPIEELVPIAESVLHTPRAPAGCGCSCAATPTAATCSCLVYLPRDRYTTAVRERIADILKDRLGGDSAGVHRPGQRVDARPAALRDPRPSAGETDRRLRRGRARAPAGRGRPLLARRLRRRRARRVRRGGRRRCSPASTPTRSPRPTRRTTRRGPGRSTSAAWRASPSDGGLDLSFYQLPDAGPERGAAEDLPHRLADVAVRGAADAVLDGRRGRRRAALRASTGSSGSRYIYDFGLRYHRRAARRESRELFQDAVTAVWEGDNEVDGFNALVLAVGLTWRQATVLRAYAKYMRQGGTPFAQDYIEDALQQNVDITRAAGRAVRGPLRPGPQRRPGRRRRDPAGQDRRDRGAASTAPSTTSRASTTTGSCGPT